MATSETASQTYVGEWTHDGYTWRLFRMHIRPDYDRGKLGPTYYDLVGIETRNNLRRTTATFPASGGMRCPWGHELAVQAAVDAAPAELRALLP